MKAGAQYVHRKPTKLEDLEKLLASIADEFCLGTRDKAPHKK